MKLTVENSSSATVEQTFASHVEKSVREEACRQSGAISYEVSIAQNADGGARVQVDRVMAPEVPDFIKKFVGESISIRQIEEWGPPDAQGSRTASIKLTIKGQPATMVGSAVLAANGSGSKEVVTGDVKVAIPLLGRKIEPEIVKVIEAALRIEQRVGDEWVAQRD
ncbi:MAG: DUF2505 domain-containing protein [Actinomycetota bacterium]|nr:DUF2505 domain-containing protein [Actinomycetota bacterium]MDQ2956573.1 DUF2505 domain-containing protein [Actinomycetota bacterium]